MDTSTFYYFGKKRLACSVFGIWLWSYATHEFECPNILEPSPPLYNFPLFRFFFLFFLNQRNPIPSQILNPLFRFSHLNPRFKVSSSHTLLRIRAYYVVFNLNKFFLCFYFILLLLCFVQFEHGIETHLEGAQGFAEGPSYIMQRGYPLDPLLIFSHVEEIEHLKFWFLVP